VNHGVARSRATVAGHQHAARELESEDGRRLRRNECAISGRGRWLGCALQQTFTAQDRRKIFTRSRKVRIERQRRLVHYWPVRWRERFDWFGFTFRVFFNSVFCLGRAT